MRQQVKFAKVVQTRAGNKSPYSSGVEIEDESWYTGKGTSILIHNLNRKDGNRTTDLHLNIPKENIQELIEALKQFV